MDGGTAVLTMGEHLRGRLRRRADEVLACEPLVRAGDPEAVHQMRVACRQLRAVLASTAPVVKDPRATRLRDELRWAAGELGRSRDTEVLRQRLEDLLRDEAAAVPQIGARLAAEAEAGRVAAVTALDSDRWQRLRHALREVDGLRLQPVPAHAPAADVLTELLDRQGRRLRRAKRRARHASHDVRDAAVHEVRKRAKALRYTAEMAEPVLGASASTIARRAREIQDLLGEHQDTVVARRFLRDLVGVEGLGPSEVFVLGRLDELEARRAKEVRHDYRRAWHRMPRRVRSSPR